jgi:hypothetical protein
MSGWAVNGDVASAWAARGLAAVSGRNPLTITPWDHSTQTATGDPIVFKHDEQTVDLEAVEAGLLVDEELVTYTQSPLIAGAVYWHSGQEYTAEEAETDRAGTPDATFPCRTVLRAHAA